MLKHMSEKALKTFQETVLYRKKSVILPANRNRRSHADNDVADRMDSNLSDRITKFNDVINSVPLRFLVDIGLLNFPVKIDSKTICTLESDMNKLFESNAKVTTAGAPDTKIIWHESPFIQHEQIRFNDNSEEYLKGVFQKNYFEKSLKKHHTKSLTN